MSKPTSQHRPGKIRRIDLERRNEADATSRRRSSESSWNEPGPIIMLTPRLTECRPSRKAMLGACRSVQEFEKLNRVGEGTYGIVYRARDTKSKNVVALKRIKLQHELGGMPISSIREVSLLRKANGHPNVVQLVDVVVGRDLDSVFLSMEYCEQDLATLIDHLPIALLEEQVKCLMQQLVRGLEYLHSINIVHRDLKMSNLLLTNKGILKIADFGMARLCGESLESDVSRDLSPEVITLWYRAPEVLFGDTKYSFGVDIWALGCILGEMLLHEPLMPGKNAQHQIELACHLLGSPSREIWPEFHELPHALDYRMPDQPYNTLRDRFPLQSKKCIDMLNQLLKYDPKLRPSASAVRCHQYWFDHPLPMRPSDMPTFSHINSA